MMKLLILGLIGLSLSGCALLAAGAAGIGWEAHRNWCIQQYGNPDCVAWRWGYHGRYGR